MAELEEIVEFRKLEERSLNGSEQHPVNRPNVAQARKNLLNVWRDRLAGCRVDAEHHSSILAVRSLVLGPDDEVESILLLSELSRQAQRLKFAERVLLDPLTELNANLDGPAFGFGLPDALKPIAEVSKTSNGNSVVNVIDRIVTGDLRGIYAVYDESHEKWSGNLVAGVGGTERLDTQHQLYFAFVKHLWHTERRDEAMSRLRSLCDVIDVVGHCRRVHDKSLIVACWLELGDWKISHVTSPGSLIDDQLQVEALSVFKRATMMDNCGYRAWHAWALLNLRIVLQQRDRESSASNENSRFAPRSSNAVRNHVVAAVKGFVNAISLGTRKWSASVQQDLLSLLTCLFKYGRLKDVASVINDHIGGVAIEVWLGVLPQLLARIHIRDPSIRAVLHPLLIRLGEKHPQALMYPLSVLLNSPVAERKSSAESLMKSLQSHSGALLEEAQMVSSELIRVAILWLEMWHEGLEDASRLHFGEGNVAGMMDLLCPLHELLEKGAATIRENDFLATYGEDLGKAHQFIKDYAKIIRESGGSIPTGHQSNDQRPNEEAETAMHRAWGKCSFLSSSCVSMAPHPRFHL